ncbi:MAG TPA: FAD-dependent oxidoreductase [Myxococcales bacterium]
MLPGRLHCAADLRPGTRLQADAAVIGSGAGGAAAALELSKQGMKVIVLEEAARSLRRTWSRSRAGPSAISTPAAA